MSFRFNNGIPNQLTLDSTPWGRKANSDDHGVLSRTADRRPAHRHRRPALRLLLP